MFVLRVRFFYNKLYKFKVSDFVADRVNAVVKQQCCDVVSNDRVRVFELMRDLSEICDIVDYLAVI